MAAGEEHEMLYKIHWNNYGKEMRSIIGNLLETGAGSDVTLSCEGQKIKCHRFIIQACSEYFNEELSTEDPNKEVTLCLRMDGVSFSDLRDLLTFMYTGQVHIPVERLPVLFKVAEILRMKNLANPNNIEWCAAPRAAPGGGSSSSNVNSPPPPNLPVPALAHNFARFGMSPTGLPVPASTNSGLHPSCFSYPNPLLSSFQTFPFFSSLLQFVQFSANNAGGQIRMDGAAEEGDEEDGEKTPGVQEEMERDDDESRENDMSTPAPVTIKQEPPEDLGGRQEFGQTTSRNCSDVNDKASVETPQQPNYLNLLPMLKMTTELKKSAENLRPTPYPVKAKRSPQPDSDGKENKPGTAVAKRTSTTGRPRGRPSMKPAALTESTMGPPKDAAEREDRLKQATSLALTGGLSARQAAIVYDIHRTTLYRYMKLHNVSLSQRKRKASMSENACNNNDDSNCNNNDDSNKGSPIVVVEASEPKNPPSETNNQHDSAIN